MINSIGPRTEPWGTPLMASAKKGRRKAYGGFGGEKIKDYEIKNTATLRHSNRK